jgi:NAD(P)-dependent dehydrogenase (short-subunit alcohol dehydrogenase family)
MGRVDGKIALVTGGAMGLGKAAAMLLSRHGAKISLADINEPEGQNTADEIAARGGDVMFQVHDVSDPLRWVEVVDATVERYGRLDVLVNNAGIAIAANVETTSLEDWRKTMAVNLDGVFYYCASKGGVRTFTKAAAVHCGEAGYKIRVNSIHPGYVVTPQHVSYLKALGNYEEENDKALSRHPIGYLGEPDDIAYGVLYLASDESKFVTGSEFVIDGGYLAR